MNITTTILCVLGIVGVIPTVLSVLMLIFAAIYNAIWEDESNTSFWKKYEYVLKMFATIGLFFLVVAAAFFVIMVLVSAL